MYLKCIPRTVLAIAIAVVASIAPAQFDSGSTSNEDLNVTTNTTLPLPPDGILEYNNVTVQGGVTLTFQKNAANTPVIILAAGDVTIAGTINVAGAQGINVDQPAAGTPGGIAEGGPGGFPGGIGGVPTSRGGTGIGSPGGGPGGGAAATDPTIFSGLARAGNGGSHFTAGGVGQGNPNPAADIYGDPLLLTLSGGSGGAGGNMIIDSSVNWDGASGGGGGGAILIAASGTITINGQINANGGGGQNGHAATGGGTHGSGGGSGGAIRLMANNITGNGTLTAVGGGGASGQANGGQGLIRIETFNLSGNIGNNSNPPAAMGTPEIIRIPPGSVPTIKISSIAGQNVAANPSGSLTSPDIIIPSSTSNPVTIGIQTTNIPNGAVIKLRIVLLNGTTLNVTSTPVNNNAATAQVTLPSTVGVIYASTDFTP